MYHLLRILTLTNKLKENIRNHYHVYCEVKIMSWWTYINGTITVHPLGRTQPEKRYILDTVLNHLPLVTGSEGNMNVYVIQKDGYNSSSSCDEFGQITNNLVDSYGDKSRKRGWLRTQDEYILTINASLRDKMFEKTYKDFQKWICRLAKRVGVENVLVEIKDYDKSIIIQNTNNAYGEMFEDPTWSNSNNSECTESNWCEYLLWSRAKKSSLPIMLEYKYFSNKEKDKETEWRISYEKD